MKKQPCKDCTRRRVGCHAECPDYWEWKEYMRGYAEWKRKQNMIAAYEKETRTRLVKRLEKWRNSK